MFGITRRRMKLGRVKKVQLAESAPGGRSPMRPLKRSSNQNNEGAQHGTDHPNEPDCQSPPGPEINGCTSGSSENWMVLSISGDKPAPRFNHAATVVGNKMIVVGGESGNGLLDDVQVLKFNQFTWTAASSKLYLSPSSLPLKIPACRGHSLVSWGKKVLLIGGKTEPGSDRVAVWALDTETECWSLMEAKGDIPVARSGHSVVRANTVLILFGGEDAKRRKLNDLHMFDLKSLTWLPLHCTGTGPSPRSNHVATLFDDKTLFIFGGASKSRTLNDLYSLDFETMIWSRIKIRGYHPSPRSGSCGVLCGTKWYIAGGGSRKKRHAETLIFDVLKVEWSIAVSSPTSSVAFNKGFSLVLVNHKEKDFLVAFGGFKKEPSNQVEVLIVDKNESSMGRRPNDSKAPGSLFGKRLSSRLANQLSGGSSRRLVDSVARQNLASVIEQHGSGRKSLSESTLTDSNPPSGNVSLRKQFSNEEDYSRTLKIAKCLEEESSLSQVPGHRRNHSDAATHFNGFGDKALGEETSLAYESENFSPHKNGTDGFPVDDDVPLPQNNSKLGPPPSASSSSTCQFYENKIAALIKKNGVQEGQLAAALASQEAAEKSLSSAHKSRQEMEKKLSETMKEMELLKERLAGLELAQEEANSLSNIVHSDNVRLEHDVAFLKAVLDDTQKELLSTRGVLNGERARTFQLQVEVFHLKQRLQSMENRAPTPRKPFHV
ncbi:acyl-CoA-binding domain-containing protein 6 [Punica granatum]|uniref:Acyl-CoA-binding domain-containing protein 6 n=1 Tax=Punica granatum TaxID=22663 RepID=A0A6P8DW48_PUNGR|nr:acyl-CoA-binding domain-containing protein 6 [Punica granatum]